MILREVVARSILTKSRLPEADYCINPYVGCAHGCVYCYARYMRRFSAHSEPWGQFVDVKTNAVELLRARLSHKPAPGGVVLFGSATDAYQQVEHRYGLTRGLLAALAGSSLTVSILTKSDLVVRDIDLLRRLPGSSVGLTITAADDGLRRLIEPHAVSVARRLAALRRLHETGLATSAFIGPIVPGLTDLPAIFAALEGIVDGVWGEALNTAGGNWSGLEAALQRGAPERLAELRAALHARGYWDEVEAQFRDLCAKHGLPLIGFYRHGGGARPGAAD